MSTRSPHGRAQPLSPAPSAGGLTRPTELYRRGHRLWNPYAVHGSVQPIQRAHNSTMFSHGGRLGQQRRRRLVTPRVTPRWRPLKHHHPGYSHNTFFTQTPSTWRAALAVGAVATAGTAWVVINRDYARAEAKEKAMIWQHDISQREGSGREGRIGLPVNMCDVHVSNLLFQDAETPVFNEAPLDAAVAQSEHPPLTNEDERSERTRIRKIFNRLDKSKRRACVHQSHMISRQMAMAPWKLPSSVLSYRGLDFLSTTSIYLS